MKAIAILGAILGLTSVVMGAASDHLFSDFITSDNADRLDVALRYHQLYAILIFCMSVYGLRNHTSAVYKMACYIFCAGTIVFCTSLYISLNPQFLHAIYVTPVGGTLLIMGWIFLLFHTALYKPE